MENRKGGYSVSMTFEVLLSATSAGGYPLQPVVQYTSNPPFAGRERVVKEIVMGVLSDPPTSYSLVGSKFVGKSRLLNFLASEEGPLISDNYMALRPHWNSDFGRNLPVRVDCSVPSAQRDFLGYLADQTCVAIRAEGGLGVPFDRFEGLEAAPKVLALVRFLAKDEFRFVFLLDHFDRVFGSLPLDTLNEMRPLTYHAGFVVASEQPLHDLDRSLAASPLFNVMTQVFLGLVEPEVARQWLNAYADEYPNLRPIVANLPELTATHPYLLRRLGDILDEVAQMIPEGMEMGPEHLPLIRLRLAEHGRLLFETLWRRVQNPPGILQKAVVVRLVERLVKEPVLMSDLASDERGPLNWLINQAMVTCCGMVGGKGLGYELFSPLFSEFLAERLALLHAAGADAGAERQNGGTNGANGAAATAAPAGALGSAPAYGGSTDADGFGEEAPEYKAEAPPAFLAMLTRSESVLLGYFQHHARQVVSPEQLLREVWRRPDATPRRVQEAIRRLRIVLEMAAPPIGTIENDRGRGYRFVPASGL
ncbi:MAG: winged helix-turn-helix domain-containing protein [Caldilineaceae bacterium]